MKKVIEFDEKCSPCHGMGLYVGMAERDGYAVVCRNCNGTGKYHFKHEYEDFQAKEKRDDITRVIQFNPGFCVGGKLNFGGMSYENWLKGAKFDIGMEMRECVCPAWWYQSADYSKKPEWRECNACNCFSNCKHFPQKDKCWERWDKEYR